MNIPRVAFLKGGIICSRTLKYVLKAPLKYAAKGVKNICADRRKDQNMYLYGVTRLSYLTPFDLGDGNPKSQTRNSFLKNIY